VARDAVRDGRSDRTAHQPHRAGPGGPPV